MFWINSLVWIQSNWFQSFKDLSATFCDFHIERRIQRFDSVKTKNSSSNQFMKSNHWALIWMFESWLWSNNLEWMMFGHRLDWVERNQFFDIARLECFEFTFEGFESDCQGCDFGRFKSNRFIWSQWIANDDWKTVWTLHHHRLTDLNSKK